MNRGLSFAALVLAATAGWAGPAHAQPVGTISAVVNDPYRPVVVAAPSGYWGYTSDPYGGYLRGVAAVTRSQGQWLIYQQQAIRMREETRQIKFDNRRKELEQWAWERDFLADYYQRQREKMKAAEIERSRTDPPLSEILAASSLNTLLHELKKNPNLSSGGSMPIEREWLAHVNTTFITTGAGGNVGLLKNDHVPWPLLVRREEYRDVRERVEKLLLQARREALGGATGADTLIELRQQVDRLEKRLDQENRSNRDSLWTPSDFVRAYRGLRELKASFLLLEREDAAYYLNPLKGNNVAELVQYMTANGLSFAPATTGGERFYIALHRAMAQEFSQVSPGKP